MNRNDVVCSHRVGADFRSFSAKRGGGRSKRPRSLWVCGRSFPSRLLEMARDKNVPLTEVAVEMPWIEDQKLSL